MMTAIDIVRLCLLLYVVAMVKKSVLLGEWVVFLITSYKLHVLVM